MQKCHIDLCLHSSEQFLGTNNGQIHLVQTLCSPGVHAHCKMWPLVCCKVVNSSFTVELQESSTHIGRNIFCTHQAFQHHCQRQRCSKRFISVDTELINNNFPFCNTNPSCTFNTKYGCWLSRSRNYHKGSQLWRPRSMMFQKAECQDFFFNLLI